MNWLDKIKKGVSDAGNKAKLTVEINRLKLQISAKKREIEVKYKMMGEAYFRAHVDGQAGGLEALLQGYCEDIVHHQNEIAALQAKIKEISREKECRCGKIVAYDTKFCSECGHEFKGDEQVFVPNTLPRHLNCPACESELDDGAKFCSACGQTII